MRFLISVKRKKYWVVIVSVLFILSGCDVIMMSNIFIYCCLCVSGAGRAERVGGLNLPWEA